MRNEKRKIKGKTGTQFLLAYKTARNMYA